VFKSGSGRGA